MSQKASTATSTAPTTAPTTAPAIAPFETPDELAELPLSEPDGGLPVSFKFLTVANQDCMVGSAHDEGVAPGIATCVLIMSGVTYAAAFGSNCDVHCSDDMSKTPSPFVHGSVTPLSISPVDVATTLPRIAIPPMLIICLPKTLQLCLCLPRTVADTWNQLKLGSDRMHIEPSAALKPFDAPCNPPKT